MKKTIAVVVGVASLAFAIPAHAQSASCQNQVQRNQVVGGVAGALLGGLAGGAIGNNVGNDNGFERRDLRNLSVRDIRRLRQEGGFQNVRFQREDNSSRRVAIGAVLGAAAGGFAGYRVGGARTNCPTVYGPQNVSNATFSQPTQVRTVSAPSTVRYPTTTQSSPTTSTQVQCQTVQQETRLPNGQVVSQPAQACQTGPNGEWEIRAGTLTGGAIF